MTSRQAFDKYGDPVDRTDEATYMMLWNVPKFITKHIPTIPNRIYCNREIELPLQFAFMSVIDKNLQNEILTWDGCFNIRLKRGINDRTIAIYKKLIAEGKINEAANMLSLHSWGLAIDINAAWNGMGRKPTMSEELVQCFLDAGFDWGGFWKGSNIDGMHFQLSYLT